jgi:hypothetical protein
MMIRYEDLKTHAMQPLQKVYGQLKFAIPGDVGAKAVGLSSFANLLALQTAYNYGGRPIAKDFRFMPKGLSGKASRYSQPPTRPTSPTRRATQ